MVKKLFAKMPLLTQIELRLCELVDYGAVFNDFSVVEPFDDFAVVPADYHFHEAVNAMGRIWAYPREWHDDAVLPCEFVYYAIHLHGETLYIVKFINKLGLFIIDGQNIGLCQSLVTYWHYLEEIFYLDSLEDAILDHRLHDFLQTDANYSNATAAIDKVTLLALMGNFNGAHKIREEVKAFMNSIEEDPTWTPLLKAHFYGGKQSILKILSNPHAISTTNWIENFKKGSQWALSIPTFDKLFIEIP